MSENIETPEGWTPSGPCFTRVHDGKFALLEHDPDDDDWYPTVYVAPGDSRDDTWLPLHEAVAWANDVLGVPKPVELVEWKFSDGSVVIHDTDMKRSARVCRSSVGWHVEPMVATQEWPTEEQVFQAARAYVRGDA